MISSTGRTPFDPLAKPEPDVTLGVEAWAAGGLSIFPVKKTMNDKAYARRDGCNVLIIRKRT